MSAKLLFCIFFIAFTIFFSGLPSYAVEIEPMRLELVLPRGQTHTGSLNLVNHKTNPVEISLSPGEYRYIFSSGTIFPKDPDKRNLLSCRGWITFSPDRFKLEAGESIKIEYKINVSDGAYGEYVASILVDEERQISPFEKDAFGEVRVKITPRISIPVYIAIKETEAMSAKVQEVKVNRDPESKMVTFTVVLLNTGTVHLRPTGNIIIMNENSQVAAKLPTGKCLPIFPEYGERIPVSWKPSRAGIYTAIVTIDIGTNQLLQEKIEFEVK